MLKIKVINNLNYTTNNGYTQFVAKTNIKRIFSIVYKINKLTIY